MKDEREAINRNTVQQRLIKDAKRSMAGAFLLLILGGVLFAYLFLVIVNEPFFPTYKHAFITTLSMAIVGLMVFLFFFGRALWRLIKARRGAFSVEEDVLVEVEEKFSIWLFLIYFGYIFRKRDCCNYIFKFESGKKFVINSGEFQHTRLGAAAEFSVSGDHFFNVFYDSNPQKLMWLYSAKTHNYKE